MVHHARRIFLDRLKTYQLFLALVMFSATIFLLYWLAFYPGILSPDSGSQFIQFDKSAFDNWHPYVHTLWVGLLRLGTATPAMSSLLQSRLSAVIFAGLSSWLIKNGVSAKVIIPLHILLSFSPVAGYYNITLWKDITAAQFVTVLLWIWLFVSRNRLRVSYRSVLLMLFFSFCAFMAATTRHNHLILLPIVITLFVFFTDQPRILRAIFSIALITTYVVSAIPIWTGQIIDYSRFTTTGLQLWILGYAERTNSFALSQTERAEIRALIAPIDYGIGCVDWQMWSLPKDSGLLVDPENRLRIQALFTKLVVQDIGTILGQRVCVFSSVLGLTVGNGYFANSDASLLAGDGQYYQRILRPDSKLPALKEFLSTFLSWSRQIPQRYLLWNHLWGVFGFLALSYAFVKNSRRLAGGVVLMYGALIGTVFLLTVSFDWRYLYFLYPFAFYSLPILILARRMAQ